MAVPFTEIGSSGERVGFEERDGEFSFEFIDLECFVTFF